MNRNMIMLNFSRESRFDEPMLSLASRTGTFEPPARRCCRRRVAKSRPLSHVARPNAVLPARPGRCPPDWSQAAMTMIRGAAAAVTGAASGIGRALALELAGRGCDLALADRDEGGLKALAAEIGHGPSPKVTLHRVDVSDP